MGAHPTTFEGYATKAPDTRRGLSKNSTHTHYQERKLDAGKWTPHMYESVWFDYATDPDAAQATGCGGTFSPHNVPSKNAVARAWSDPHLRRKLGATTKHKCEASNREGKQPSKPLHAHTTAEREPPIKNVQLSWDDWLRKIDEAVNTSVLEPNSRFYFRFSVSIH